MKKNRILAILMALAITMTYMPAMAYGEDAAGSAGLDESAVTEQGPEEETAGQKEPEEAADVAGEEDTKETEVVVSPNTDTEELLSIQEQDEEEGSEELLFAASGSTEWEKTGNGTVYYAEFPSGYYTQSPLYQKYNRSKVTAYENASNKREISTNRVSWIYWHWTFNNKALPNNNYNVLINEAHKYEDGHDYQYFTDFESAENYEVWSGDPRVFKHWRNRPEDGSWWWFRIPVYEQTYTDYRKAAPADDAPVCSKPVPKIDAGTVRWSRSDKADGYVIEYSTSPNFGNSKKVTVIGRSSCSCRLTGLKAGTNYYIRICIYIVKNGQKKCGKWSGVCRMKTYTSKGNLSDVRWYGLKDCAYSGKAIRKSFKLIRNGVVLEKGKDYTVSYRNNTEVGTATVIVKGCGKYFGTIKNKYVIRPRGTTPSKATGGTNCVTVRWSTRRNNCSGYQIRYCTRSDFKNCKKKFVKGRTTGSYTISGLSANTKYYIEVRIYYIVGGKKYYSGWSKCVSAVAKGKSAPAAKSYRVITETPIKAGSYYFKMSGDRLLRSKSRNSGYSVVLDKWDKRIYHGEAITNGKYIFAVEGGRYSDSDDYLVRYSVSGTNRRVVKTLPSSGSLGFWSAEAARGQFIILSRYVGSSFRVYTYRYNTGNGQFGRVANDVAPYECDAGGTYVLCEHALITSGLTPWAKSLYRVTSSGKMQRIRKLGDYVDAEFIGNKLYYVTFDVDFSETYDYPYIRVYRCNRDGSNRELITSFIEEYETGTFLHASNFTRSSCEINISGNKYLVDYSTGDVEPMY